MSQIHVRVWSHIQEGVRLGCLVSMGGNVKDSRGSMSWIHGLRLMGEYVSDLWGENLADSWGSMSRTLEGMSRIQRGNSIFGIHGGV
ncbi:hypothetical protein QJS04_geneDACA016362 [Acorus gramineus]|uniref:Uncharacterized protein n=1 Tax=Acorus gramineus TaxID=55184 RepID=A0AAV9AUC4_ACOGR|nr:hypothetical protein QJS04_geneDACA016362 [Acorus gramineus]